MRRLLLVLLVTPKLAAAGAILPVATDFEMLTTAPGMEFSIGSVGQRATFGGTAFSGSLGLFQLYNSGFFSWMIEPGGSGFIAFEGGASQVRLFATAFSTADSDLEIFVHDSGGEVIDMALISPGSGFRELVFAGDIGFLAFDNFSTVEGSFAAVDDFSFVPAEVPEPAVVELLGLGLWAALLRRSVRLRRVAERPPDRCIWK